MSGIAAAGSRFLTRGSIDTVDWRLIAGPDYYRESDLMIMLKWKPLGVLNNRGL